MAAAVPPEQACRVDPASLIGKYVRVDGEVGLVTTFDQMRNPAGHSYHGIRFQLDGGGGGGGVRRVLLRRRKMLQWNTGRPFAILDTEDGRAVLATAALRRAMEARDLRQLRSAIATAEEEKAAEATVIEEAKAVLATVLATEALRRAMEARDMQQPRSAIATAEEEKVVEASVIEEAKTLLATIPRPRADVVLSECMEERGGGDGDGRFLQCGTLVDSRSAPADPGDRTGEVVDKGEVHEFKRKEIVKHVVGAGGGEGGGEEKQADHPPPMLNGKSWGPHM